MAVMRFKPGETYARDMTFTENGSLFDITGRKVFWTVKSGTDFADANAILQKSFTQADAGSAGSGLLSFSLTGSDTEIFSPGSYPYDFKIISGTGAPANANYISGVPPFLIVDPRVTVSGAF